MICCIKWYLRVQHAIQFTTQSPYSNVPGNRMVSVLVVIEKCHYQSHFFRYLWHVRPWRKLIKLPKPKLCLGRWDCKFSSKLMDPQHFYPYLGTQPRTLSFHFKFVYSCRDSPSTRLSFFEVNAPNIYQKHENPPFLQYCK